MCAIREDNYKRKDKCMELDFLKKYILNKSESITLLSKDEILNLDNEVVPTNWIKALKEESFKDRRETILKEWKENVGSELSNTISYLENYCIAIDMLKINNKYSLLYTIQNRDGKILFYEGRNPLDKIKNDNLIGVWSKMPEKIRAFYERVHNGFYYYASKSMGLSSYDEIFCLDDYEWGILEEVSDLKIDLKTSYAFFSNGIGMYVAVDYNRFSNSNSALWSSKEEPEYEINFWDIIDEWIVIGFE